MTDALAERLQAILDWADLALANPDEFNAHGVKNLDGPVFDEARRALASRPSAIVEEPMAGWKLVPVEITLSMQKAYFDVIDKNMPRIEKDLRFGRFDSNREAYRALLAAAPPSPQPHTGKAGVTETTDAVRQINNLLAAAKAFLEYFNPSDLAEDKSQQWLSVFDQIGLVEARLPALNAALTVEPEAGEVQIGVDELAQHIRIVDGENSLGAGALAEKLLPFILRHAKVAP